MKLKGFLLVGLLLLVRLLYAQTDFRPGYVINLDGDTVKGLIDYRGDALMSSVCKFKNAENEIIEFSPYDILGFRFIESKYYVSKEIKSVKIFMEYLIKGIVNIYYMRDEYGNHYFLEKDGEQLTEIAYEEGIRYVDDKRFLYKSKTHIGLLNYYMQDAPEMKSRINAINKPDHKNLISLAEDYHKMVCDGEACIIYEKKEPFLKVNFEGVAGVVKYENVDGIRDKNYFQYGILAHIWLPRTNEKLYLKTGFLYSEPIQNGEKKNHMKVPLHIEYLAPNTYRIRPTASIGLLTPSYSAGVLVKLNKRINIGVHSWVNFDYDRVPWIPSKLFNYSLLGGLYIEL